MISGKDLDRAGAQGFGWPGFVTALFEKTWWALAARGLLAISLGVTAFAIPGLALMVSLAVIGGYMVLDGALTLITALRLTRSEHSFWPYVVEGALSVVIGVLAFTRPEAFVLATLLLIALRSIVTGTIELAAGARLRRETGIREWALWIAGVASIVFGVGLVLAPGFGIPMLMRMISVYTVVLGGALLGEGLHLRSMALRLHHAHVR